MAGDELHFSLESAEQARGPINLRPCVIRSFIDCLVVAVLCPDLPVNQGISRPIHVAFPPEGSILNPRYPAPVNMYVRPAQMVTSVVQMLLAETLPEVVPAPDSGAGGSVSISGQDADRGRWFSLYDLNCGGGGARADADGPAVLNSLVINVMEHPGGTAGDGVSPSASSATSCSRNPAAPAVCAAGLGMVRDWTMLADETYVNLRSDRFKYSAPGLHGARHALPSSAFLNPGTEREEALPSKVSRLRLGKGDVFRIQYAGGGGRGDPLEREPSRVLDDVRDGYISARNRAGRSMASR